MKTETKLRIAIQKSGRLNDDSIRMLKECGIEFDNGLNKLKASAFNFPLEVLFLRDDDIPEYVEQGVADIGIVGENVLVESGAKVKLIEKLGYGKCRLSIAVPKDVKYSGIKDLNGKRIATTYSRVLQKYLAKNKVKAEIHEISGSVEIATGIGLAEAICDIVSSGSTLFTNGLKEVETVMKSEAVLIGNNKLNAAQLRIVERLLFRIRASRTAKRNKYLLLNAPDNKLDTICKLIPGMKSPTVLPLKQKGWSSVHSVIDEEKFWDIIEQLRDAGAEGILVVPIEKMVV
ncbi:MAG: ATP phosphoribosyltransferase [Bacteroidia bacterium]|nr:ATP phosphoribosyltransferase [Bacteroidia bacterium]